MANECILNNVYLSTKINYKKCVRVFFNIYILNITIIYVLFICIYKYLLQRLKIYYSQNPGRIIKRKYNNKNIY